MSVISKLFGEKRVLLDDMGFVDGLLDPKIRVLCAQVENGGRMEWACWECGETAGLFDVDVAVDIPRNTAGAWVRLHKRCA